MSSIKTHIHIGRRTYHIAQLAFLGLVLLYALIILLTFRDYGITSDEGHHINYGAQIVTWYANGFDNPSLFQTNNTWLYGGFFDTTAHLLSQILPFERHNSNHLYNAIFGLLGIVAAYRIGFLLGGPTAGFISALALFLTPRYYGHAFNNPKDIPFAVCYLWSVYYLLQCYKTFPKLPTQYIIGTGISIGLALGIRIGGSLLIAYLVLITAIKLYHHRQNILPTLKAALPKLGLALLIAYVLMLISWPYALLNPISGPLYALQQFSQFTEHHTSFFDGRYVLNTQLPRTYAPTWFILTLPEFAFVGMLVGLYFVSTQKHFDMGFVFFAGIFPILYAVIMATPLYDGLRHLLFAMPPLIVFGALGLHTLIQQAKFQNMGVAITALLSAGVAFQMVRLHPNQYVYFNTLIAGGIQKASEKYETDYWENSLKQGIQWAEKNVIVPTKIKINTSNENLRYMVGTAKSVVVHTPEEADIYLGTTRYDKHRIVPGEILHTITSANTPLLYVIRPDTTYQNDPFFTDSPFYQFRVGEIHEAKGRPEQALSAFQKSLSITKEQALTEPFFLMRIYIRIGNQYEALNQFENALHTYHKALSFDPQNGALHNNIGIVYARLQQPQEAIMWLQKAIAINPDYFTAAVNLGGVAAQIEQWPTAQEAYTLALTVQDDLAIRYSLGKVEYIQGHYEQARTHFEEILHQQSEDAQTWYDLSLTCAALTDYEQAQSAIQNAIQFKPDDPKFYFTLGSIAMYRQNYVQAIRAYQKVLEYEAQNADAYVGLGVALAYHQDLENAQRAFQNALIINPQHEEARHHLQSLKR